METLEFLKKILPSSGIYFIDCPFPTGRGFKHHACETVERAAQVAAVYDEQRATVYHACASFQSEFIERADAKGEVKRVSRVQENVKYVRSFWLDLDVDASNARKFPSQAAALEALVKFCGETGLPVPLVVNSGYGVHCYWVMDQDVLPGQWKETAIRLKALTAALDFGQGDTTRTADMASVLRPVGTHNRKASAMVPVSLVADAEPMSYATFDQLVTQGCTKHKAELPKSTKPKIDPNAAFALQTNYPDSHAEEIAKKCQQVRLFRDDPNTLDEPTWYAGVQLLYHTVESEEVIHRWSSGYAGYSEEETSRKIIQIAGFGPSTCATFNSRNPGGCVGCKFAGKVASPIQLGAIVESLPPPTLRPDSGLTQVVERLCNPPYPFTRTKDGIYVDVEGAPVKFYDYDLYPTDLNDDDHLGYETATIRHFLPHEGWLEFCLPTYLVEDKKQFLMHLRKNFIKPPDGHKMVAYVDQYLRSIQQQAALRKSFTSMGWKHDFSQFVLGHKLFKSDGTVFEAGMSQKLSNTLTGVTTKGDINEWVRATEMLERKGAEAHAFSMLQGFGAPLLKLTGFHGLTFSMVGETGVGKSMMARFALSIYGDFDKLRIGYQGTKLAKMERLGAYNNLPAYIDEMTNLEPDEVSDLMYEISDGKGRERLNRDSSSKGMVEWSTFLITSANASLAQKLSAKKSSPEAELMRLFEYDVPRLDPEFNTYMKSLYTVLNENYGHAGEVYIHWLVQNTNQAKKIVNQIREHIEEKVLSDGRDRFWVSGVSCCIAGGYIARQLGLIRFDPMPVLEWACDKIKMLRWSAAEAQTDELSLLGEYLDEYAGCRLVVTNLQIGGGLDRAAIHKAPGGGAPLLSRFELDTKYAFVSRKHLNEYITRRRGNFGNLRKAMLQSKVLLDHNARKILGAGTEFSGTQVPCWKLDLGHPAFETLVRSLEAMKGEGPAHG